MNRRAIIALATAALLAGCTDESSTSTTGGLVSPEQSQVPLTFDTYTARQSVTRLGETGTMTTERLAETGFGVFCYYSNGTEYGSDESTFADGTTLKKPNYMYNQKVSGTTDGGGTITWSYEPIKYWPNETGTTNIDQNGASAQHTDYLSFFAYAPFVGDEKTGLLDDAEGDGTQGITELTANSATGDPMVHYVIPDDPAESVDMLWGVAPAGTTKDGKNVIYTAVNGSDIVVDEGLPLTNLVKPETGQNVKFLFRHALARLGVKVSGMFNNAGTSSGASSGSRTRASDEDIATNSKVTVEKVTLAGKFKKEGWLSLNNTDKEKAKWTDRKFASGDVNTTRLSVNKDNKLNSTVTDAGEKKASEQPEGVTKTEKDLMTDTGGDVKYYTLIPNFDETGDDIHKIDVEITYYITTDDPHLSYYDEEGKLVSGYLRIKNVITKSIELPLQDGKDYTLHLKLGLTTFKADVTVEDWPAEISTPVDLPKNK